MADHVITRSVLIANSSLARYLYVNRHHKSHRETDGGGGGDPGPWFISAAPISNTGLTGGFIRRTRTSSEDFYLH